MTYDPLVVDSTAELDRILQSGHAPPPSNVIPPSSDSDSPPKTHRPPSSSLLSPPRLRSVQPHHPTNPISPLALSTRQVEPSKNENSMNSQPPARRSNIFPSYVPLPATSQLKFAYTRDALHHWVQVHPIGLWDQQGAQQQLYTPSNATNTRQTIIARPASVPVERSPSIIPRVGLRALRCLLGTPAEE